jgi:hypothetical protein
LTKNPLLAYTYAGLAGASLVSAALFYGFFRGYDENEERLNDLDAKDTESKVARVVIKQDAEVEKNVGTHGDMEILGKAI